MPPTRKFDAGPLLLLPVLLGAAFSFYQAGSRSFACGRDIAGDEIHAWLAVSGVQGLLYLLATRSEPARRAYALTQFALLIPLLWVVAQLSLAYPRTFVVIGLGAIVYGLGVAAERLLAPGRAARAPDASVLSTVAEIVLFLLTAAVIHSALAFVVLYTPGRTLGDAAFFAIAAVSAGTAFLLLRRDRACMARLAVTDVPPLALLLLVLLRSKLPDGAYDSLFYKATMPVLIAEWRTALTGIYDHTLVGTNFLEILNAQVRILDGEYSVAIGATLASAALWIVGPVAARAAMPAALGGARPLACAAAALSLVSLSETLSAAGTAYHEPMLALLMAASLLPFAPAWILMGAAVAAKVTVVFVLPLLVLVKVVSRQAAESPPAVGATGSRGAQAMSAIRDFAWHELRSRPLATAVALALALFVTGQQFDRNLAQTGRIMAVSEMLAGLTDPQGRVLAREGMNPVFDAAGSRIAVERYGQTFVHVLTLDRWIEPDDLGFHKLPTSRLIAVAAVIALLAPLVPALRRRPWAIALAATWLLCAIATLNFFSQGRHLFPLSVSAAFVVPLVAGLALRGSTPPREAMALAAAAFTFALAAFGDQVIGTYVNNSWDCRRPLRAGVVKNDYDRPVTPLEQRLAELVAQYRSRHPPGSGTPPTVLCEPPTERMRYLGSHYVFSKSTHLLTLRRLAAHPEDAARLPTSILAVCFANLNFFHNAIPEPQRKYFREVPGVGIIRIMVSDPLMSGLPATSLQSGRTPWLSRAIAPPPLEDFIAGWASGRLTDYARVDTPAGLGAFVMPVEGRATGVVLSPFGIGFDDVRFAEGDRLAVELAMPSAASDGMQLEFVFTGAEGARQSVRLALEPPPAGESALRWQRHRLAVPAGIHGRGSLTVIASSPSGNPTADWAYLREFRLER